MDVTLHLYSYSGKSPKKNTVRLTIEAETNYSSSEKENYRCYNINYSE
jgi:hypothetical protein